MIILKRFLIILVTGFITFYSFGLSSATALRGLKPGDPAPDFRISTIDSKEITLSSLNGNIAILAFWKRGQDFSDKALADLERIYREYRDRGVTVLAINADKASELEIRSILSTQKLSYILSTDPEFKVYGQFGVMVLPTTLVIGPEGKLAYYRSIHTKDFYSQVRGHVRVLLREITRAQLEAELNPRKIKEESPERKKANLHLMMGKMLMNTNLKDKARAELQKALQADPSLLEAHILLARLYLEEKDVTRARAELDLALKLDPGSKAAKLLMDRLENP